MTKQRTLRTLACVLAMALPAGSRAQTPWSPERAVEVIVSVSAGGNQDQTARLIQSVWQERLAVPSVVVNKSGGGGVIANNYLNQHARDPHYLMLIVPTMLTNRITGAGANNFSDYTPIAMLFNEYVFVSVRADSPLKTGRDLIQRLRAAPETASVAIATAVGNHIHMGIALPMKAAGVDIKRMTIVPYRSSGESVVALLGGHVEVVASTFSTLAPFVAAGRLRILGVSAPQRMSGPLAAVPTWKEQGAGAVFDSWRGVVGAKGLGEAQVKYWEKALEAVSQSAEWGKNAERNFRVNRFMNGQDAYRYWETQYRELEEALTELGLAKGLK